MDYKISHRVSEHTYRTQRRLIASSSLLDSSCIGLGNVLIMVLLLPPAPAALVLAGLALAVLSARSAAAFLRMAVFGPPGGVGDDGRAVLDPTDWGELMGELGCGEDCGRTHISRWLINISHPVDHGIEPQVEP